MVSLKRILLIFFIIVNSLILLLGDFLGTNNLQYLFILFLPMNMAASLLLIFSKYNRFNNITTLFLVFWFLYIINPIIYYFTDIKTISYYIHFSNLAVISFLIGYLSLSDSNNTNTSMQHFYKANIEWTSFYMLLLGFLFELINFLRVGGFLTVRRGKVTFLSELNNLSNTLPSFYIITIGVSLLSISLMKSQKSVKAKSYNLISCCILLIICSFYFLVSFRGRVLSIIIILAIGYTYDKYLRKVKPKLIVLALILFVFLQIVGQNRSLISQISFDNFFETLTKLEYNVFRIEDEERRKNEFHSAGDNFMLFYNNPEELKKNYFVGQSYLEGVFYPVPRRFYPGDKPEQLTLVFRDLYVPERARWGHQSTTGFSSLVEGYLNGGCVGIVIYFFINGVLFSLLERKRWNSKSIYFHVFYLSLIPLIPTFSRTAFAINYLRVFYTLVYIFLFIKLKHIFLIKKRIF